VNEVTAPTSTEDSEATNKGTATGNDVNAQLSEARAQIEKLKQQLTDEGLRRRKTSDKQASRDIATSNLQQQHQVTESGVPLQTAAALCLLSFLIAYFFF
jgi:hypothetical protein